MKFTFSWLKEHLDTEATAQMIAQRLNEIGLEVESLDERKKLAPFIIAKILDAVPHKNANKLQLLTVDIGQATPLQIVCGAPNARAGLKGVLARPGDYIPGLDITLSIGNIRGVESYGMMCSGAELEISQESDGIIELPEDAPVGSFFAEYSGLIDPIFEVAITPNRADCTGVYGIARDLAASGLGQLKNLAYAPLHEQGEEQLCLHVEPAAEELYHGFASRIIKGVKNGPSPLWLKQRLLAIGLRPINILVDITNYLAFDLGYPLHVFDAQKIKGNITLRTAKNGEVFTALNEKSYTLKADQLVLSDDCQILSLCGIMGGLHSGCDETTQNVIIEAAQWLPQNIAQTARQLGIQSDARYRFERGVDPLMMNYAIDKAAEMIQNLAGGQIQKKHIHKVPRFIPHKITFPLRDITRLTSIELERERIIEFLTALGCSVRDEGHILQVCPPSWRYDLSEKADLVEEIMRLYGVDRIEAQPLPKTPLSDNILNHSQSLRHDAARLLAARGMLQTINWSFIHHQEALHFGGGSPNLQLENPIAPDMSDMRPSLLPGLLKLCAKHYARAIYDVSFFEIGHNYLPEGTQTQILAIAGLRMGTAKPYGTGRFWQHKQEMVDVFDAKQDALAVLENSGLSASQLIIEQGAPSWYHPGRSGTIKLGPKNILGYFGCFHPKTLKLFKLNPPLCGFELFPENFPAPKKRANKNRPPLQLSSLQPIYRDFAFILDKSCPSAIVTKAALAADKKLIKRAVIFDNFQGGHLPKDKKSIAFEITIQPQDQSLTETQLEALSKKIIENVCQTTGGTLRDK